MVGGNFLRFEYWVLLFAIGLVTPRNSVVQPDKQTVRFVEDVLFDAEFTAKPVRFCKHWSQPPQISTFGSGSHHVNVIKNVVSQLNSCLPANLNIQILPAKDNDATIKVYFVPFDEFEKVAMENNFGVVSGNLGFFFSEWNSKFEIKRAVVLIAEDKLSGSRLHHYVLEEITQSLGFPGDSKRFEKSVFYEDNELRRFGKATLLSKLDQQLIRFHYSENQTGDTPVEVGINIAENWISN